MEINTEPNPYIPHVDKFTNSKEFSYLANIYN